MHHSYEDELRGMVEARGAHLRFLAPYCPQDNPIETGFNNFKSYLKRHHEWANTSPEPEVIDTALRRSVTPQAAANFYAGCGYSLHPSLR